MLKIKVDKSSKLAKTLGTLDSKLEEQSASLNFRIESFQVGPVCFACSHGTGFQFGQGFTLES